MPVYVLQRKQTGESLGLDVGRCFGGRLIIEDVLSGGMAERAGVVRGHALLRVGSSKVWNVSSLQEAVMEVKTVMTFEIEISEDVDAKASAVIKKLSKKRRRSVSPPSESTDSNALSPLLPLKWMDEFDPRSATTLPYAPPAIPCC
eukprot:TRINITY_DN7485_c0_g3_i1.p1 TRINITY_DN7485_c0_g3~~TRINITY_DN7485_c0_g3_i1.p1  ORF type:complete len:146 (+),score=26.98 TRINITY_DN7485_c0_g3_i1:42-479(+)